MHIKKIATILLLTLAACEQLPNDYFTRRTVTSTGGHQGQTTGSVLDAIASNRIWNSGCFLDATNAYVVRTVNFLTNNTLNMQVSAYSNSGCGSSSKIYDVNYIASYVVSGSTYNENPTSVTIVPSTVAEASDFNSRTECAQTNWAANAARTFTFDAITRSNCTVAPVRAGTLAFFHNADNTIQQLEFTISGYTLDFSPSR